MPRTTAIGCCRKNSCNWILNASFLLSKKTLGVGGKSCSRVKRTEGTSGGCGGVGKWPGSMLKWRSPWRPTVPINQIRQEEDDEKFNSNYRNARLIWKNSIVDVPRHVSRTWRAVILILASLRLSPLEWMLARAALSSSVSDGSSIILVKPEPVKDKREIFKVDSLSKWIK